MLHSFQFCCALCFFDQIGQNMVLLIKALILEMFLERIGFVVQIQ